MDSRVSESFLVNPVAHTGCIMWLLDPGGGAMKTIIRYSYFFEILPIHGAIVLWASLLCIEGIV